MDVNKSNKSRSPVSFTTLLTNQDIDMPEDIKRLILRLKILKSPKEINALLRQECQLKPNLFREESIFEGLKDGNIFHSGGYEFHTGLTSIVEGRYSYPTKLKDLNSFQISSAPILVDCFEVKDWIVVITFKSSIYVY